MKRSTVIISIILGLVLVSTVTIIAVYAIDRGGSRSVSGDTIAWVSLDGAIADSGSESLLGTGGGINPAFVRHRLETAEEDPAVKAIILKINSGGGAVGASQEIAELIRNADKPVVAFAGDTMASGAYYIASQCDKIVAKPGSLVGSIGVISMIPDLNGLYEKLGIRMQTIKSGRNKDMFQRALTQEERQKFQAMSDELYQQFVSDVARGRKLSKDKVLELATGEVFAASTAKRSGLVDVVGGYQAAVDTAAKLANIEEPYVDEYEPPTFFEELFGAPSTGFYNLIRTYLLGQDLALLERIRSDHSGPHYLYVGGQ